MNVSGEIHDFGAESVDLLLLKVQRESMRALTKTTRNSGQVERVKAKPPLQRPWGEEGPPAPALCARVV